MKTNCVPSHSDRAQQGSSVLVVMTLLGIMLALVAANAIAVHVLDRELRLLDHKQQHRWEHAAR